LLWAGLGPCLVGGGAVLPRPTPPVGAFFSFWLDGEGCWGDSPRGRASCAPDDDSDKDSFLGGDLDCLEGLVGDFCCSTAVVSFGCDFLLGVFDLDWERGCSGWDGDDLGSSG